MRNATLILIALTVMAACTDELPNTPAPPDTYDILSPPAWEPFTPDVWTEPNFTILPNGWTFANGLRGIDTLGIDARRNGNQIWITTKPDRKYTFLGTERGNQLVGHYVRKGHGYTKPIPITFQRVQ